MITDKEYVKLVIINAINAQDLTKIIALIAIKQSTIKNI